MIPKGWTNERLGREPNPWKWMQKNYPSISAYLQPFEKEAQKRWDKGDYWWELRACDYYQEFEKPKIIFPDIAKESRMSFDKDKLFMGNTGYIIPVNDLYLLGILNSKLIFSYYKRSSMVLGDPDKGGRLRWIYQDVIKIPIRVNKLHQKEDIIKQQRIEDSVKQMLKLNKDLQKAKTSHKKEVIQRQINATDRQIDKLVYKLYDLTEDEIAIVEEDMN